MKIKYIETGQEYLAPINRRIAAKKRQATIRAKQEARKLIARLVLARPR